MLSSLTDLVAKDLALICTCPQSVVCIKTLTADFTLRQYSDQTRTPRFTLHFTNHFLALKCKHHTHFKEK